MEGRSMRLELDHLLPPESSPAVWICPSTIETSRFPALARFACQRVITPLACREGRVLEHPWLHKTIEDLGHAGYVSATLEVVDRHSIWPEQDSSRLTTRTCCRYAARTPTGQFSPVTSSSSKLGCTACRNQLQSGNHQHHLPHRRNHLSAHLTCATVHSRLRTQCARVPSTDPRASHGDA